MIAYSVSHEFDKIRLFMLEYVIPSIFRCLEAS